MRRKRLFGAFAGAAVCAVMLSVGAACDKGGSNTLTFDVAATAEAAYGTYFEVPDVVGTDSEGKFYFPEIAVSDAQGNAVIYEDGKFFVSEMADYTISYTIEFGGENTVKTTSVKVSDKFAPEITLEKTTDIALLGDYTIPQPEVEDDYDSAENLEVSVAVTSSKGEVDVNEEKNSFHMDVADDYTITYTAKDKAGNSSTASMIVSAVDEDDCVTYFHHPLGGAGIQNAGYAANGGITGDYAFGEDEYSYGVAFNTDAFNADGPYVTVDIMTPYIKDITPYKYMYFYVYSSEMNISLGINNTYLANPNVINAGQAKLVYIERTQDGTDFLYMGTKLFTADEYSRVKTPTDITGLRLTVSVSESINPGYEGGGFGSVYFSPIRVADSIPLAEVEMDVSTVFTGDSFALPEATGTGFTSISQKVYYSVGGGEYTEISGGTFTPEMAGSYTLRFDVYDENVFADSIYKTLTVIAANEKEEDAVAYLHKDFGVSTLDVSAYTAALSEKYAYGNEGASAKFTPTDDAFGSFSSVGAINGHFKLKTPAIKDISSYKYLYFYIYAPNVSLRIYANNGATVWDGYETVEKGSWKRIAVTNVDGNWWFASNAQFASADQAKDITNFGFNLYVPYVGNESAATGATFGGIYVSAIRVANELPMASAELEFSTVLAGDTVNIPTAQNSGFSAFSQKVFYSLNGGAYTEIAENTFIPDVGVYTLRFDVYDGGVFIDSVFATLTAIEQEEGVVAYFHKEFGANMVDGSEFNETVISDRAHLNGEEYSLSLNLMQGWPKLFLTSPAITDLNEKENDEYKYNYLYFSVYTEYTTTPLTVWLNNAGGGAVKLVPNKWITVVAVRDGDTFKLNGADIFAAASDFTATAGNITGSFIRFDNSADGSAWARVYVSAIRASKTFDGGENVVAGFGTGIGWLQAAAGTYTASSSTDYAYEGEQYSLKLTPTVDQIGAFNDASAGYCAGDFTLASPAVKDISDANHLYFYVYSPNAVVKVYGKNAGEESNWNESEVIVPKGEWTLVAIGKNTADTWYMGNFQIMNSATGAKANDITGLGFRVNVLKADNPDLQGNGIGGVYISSVRIASELPSS